MRMRQCLNQVADNFSELKRYHFQIKGDYQVQMKINKAMGRVCRSKTKKLS
jgi:hypothetical protein